MDDPLSSDTLRGWTGGNRIAHWLLLDADRWLLAAYVLRIATVSKRTGSLGPFILRRAERTDAIDWDE